MSFQLTAIEVDRSYDTFKDPRTQRAARDRDGNVEIDTTKLKTHEFQLITRLSQPATVEMLDEAFLQILEPEDIEELHELDDHVLADEQPIEVDSYRHVRTSRSDSAPLEGKYGYFYDKTADEHVYFCRYLKGLRPEKRSGLLSRMKRS